MSISYKCCIVTGIHLHDFIKKEETVHVKTRYNEDTGEPYEFKEAKVKTTFFGREINSVYEYVDNLLFKERKTTKLSIVYGYGCTEALLGISLKLSIGDIEEVPMLDSSTKAKIAEDIGKLLGVDLSYDKISQYVVFSVS